ncbi:MAG TPA: ABC transporter permease subunit [Gemmataceae bacterium]|nr:ABC transporter permease subunit [Gemmataceae bacterium]
MTALRSPMSSPAGRRLRWGTSLLAHGEPSVWLTGGALAVSLFMIVGLLATVIVQGAATFWPGPLVEIVTTGGKTLLGEVTRSETVKVPAGMPTTTRRLLRTENFELTGSHYVWIADAEVAAEKSPEWAVVVERTEWGNFYGTPRAFFIDAKQTADTPEAVLELYLQHRDEANEAAAEKVALQRNGLGELSRREDDALLAVREAELGHGKGSAEHADAQRRFAETKEQARALGDRLKVEIERLARRSERYQIEFVTADGASKKMTLAQIVRMYPANRLSTWDKLGVYGARWGEFLTGWPRESNTEGGVFPAIVGTVLMTLLMSLAVVPFGVLAALYLREYAKAGLVISILRIAINNLAGVPSIVFGVFGLGFFCYIIGGFLDGGPRNIGFAPPPPPTWWLGIAGATVLGVFGFFAYLAGGARSDWIGSLLSFAAALLWATCFLQVAVLVLTNPYFDGFWRAKLPTPTFGTGGLLWAALTLSLLTLPVVIVSTEEALAAVPNSLREGSFACGASKWQTIRHIILPRAMPGIMTGMILAMARGAGEVAPLMLVGAVKLAPKLPIDGEFPFVHGDRSFMHLGYHIFDVGFQSPNSEAARPMVYTTALLLIVIVALLNVTAVVLRRRLRKKYLVSHF